MIVLTRPSQRAPRGSLAAAMNPFALDGPLFNLFYALFAAIVLLLLYAVRRVQEAGPLPGSS